MHGILLLAHGGPGSLQEVPAFLERLRGGRPSSPELLEKTLEKYRSLGGASPLTGVVARIADRLQEVRPFSVYFGMLHWHPLLDDVIPRAVNDGVDKILAICLLPHFSECTVGKYRRRTNALARECGLAVDFVEGWHTSLPYLDGLTESVLTSWGEHEWDSDPGLDRESTSKPGIRPHLVFSAHSLPKAALPAGDPYVPQLRETSNLVAARLGIPAEGWTLAFHNAGEPRDGWLGPTLSDLWPVLANRGLRQVTLCPVDSVVDQAEVLFDLDVAARQEAARFGVALARTRLLNDSRALVQSLALLVDQWTA